MKFSKALLLTALTLVSAEKLEYVGVNESCGEFGEGELPGIYNKHYIYPNIDAIKTTIEQGMNVFRINFRWERFQHELFGEFNEFDITEYKKVVDATTAEGATVILDPHNYARYKNNLIGSEEVPIEAFVDFWTKLAEIFKDNEKVWFGLVNEPHDMDTDDWFKAARAAVDGIRATGAKNNILIPGNGWTGAWSWGKEAWYGEANADVSLRYFSSEDENILFEVHQYFDTDYSGTHDTCVQRPCQNNLKEFVEWLKTNNLKGWVGEIGGTLNDECKECIEEVLEYLQENRDVIKGVQWWAAGPWWGHNALSIEPNAEKAFPGQMAWLKPYLPGPSELTEVPTFINKKVYCKGCVVTGTGGDNSFWGWEDEKSCEIDKETCGYNDNTPIENPPVVEKTYCKGCEVTGTGGDGSLWGWEDEQSCEIDVATCKIGNNASDDNTDNGEKLEYVGVNESCGEFGEGELPGIYNTHYIYPNIDAIKTTIEQGMNVFRINFRWERFQHELFGEFNEFDITEYKKVVDATTAEGATVILDPHNYARYNNNLIGSEEVPIEAFVDFWTKLAEIFKDNEKVWFGLVNEPHDMETDDWFKAARAAVDGIRATGAKNNILIPGNGWTGAWSWGKEAWYGEANADVSLRYFSSEDENILFEVHQYFDTDYSGSHDTCVQRPCQNNLKEFVEWLKTNNLKGWVGEIGGTLNDECKACIEEVLDYLQENRDVIKGVQWWAAGPWWGHNALSIEPNAEKAFPGQMAWLKPYLPGPSELTEVPTFINKKVYCKGCVVTGTGGDNSFWGWEDEKSCEIDKETCGYNDNTPIENPPVVEKTYCKGCEVTGTGGDGSLWGWEDEKSCEIDVAACKIGEEPTEPSTCKFEALGYKCCSHCVSYLEDEDGLWGVENGEWCGITDECIKGYDECWSNKFGYPCCDTCDVFLTDESGDWGVKDLDWCGVPSTCKAN
ncbi:glycoside hydrolase [Neocallimastix californiae]|uniref:cellulase n=1 Tax=Neocallimastix californiae TaxID=1754190 RepID=A0A1Y1YSN7_9FUNG|nr:glycoside hydrolase [Neocallimastix californiae]|eukprot:ORY00986.1 glycoside hydrolase [Neocallimastix californiae]